MCWLKDFTVGFCKTDCDSLLAEVNVDAKRCSSPNKQRVSLRCKMNEKHVWGMKMHRYLKIFWCIWHMHQIRLRKFNVGLHPDNYGLRPGFSNFWCYGAHEEIDHDLRSTTINFINAVIASLDSCKIRQASILIRTRIACGALGFCTGHFENLCNKL